MTRMQIIAKAMLTFMGVWIVLAACKHAYLLSPVFSIDVEYNNIWVLLLPIGVLIIIALWWLVLRNHRLACSISGPGEILNQPAQTLWLIASLRMSLGLAGFLLLVESSETIGTLLAVPLHLHSFLQALIRGENPFGFMPIDAAEWFRVILDALGVAFAAYLLCGAPQFVRWQVGYTSRECAALKDHDIKGSDNE